MGSAQKRTGADQSKETCPAPNGKRMSREHELKERTLLSGRKRVLDEDLPLETAFATVKLL